MPCHHADVFDENLLMELSRGHAFVLVGILTLALVCTGCGGVSTAMPGSGGGSGGGTGGSGGGGQSSCSVMSTGVGASLNGFRPFTSANLWNTNISSSPVD